MKITVNIPEKLSDITLEQYQRFLLVAETEDVDDVFLMQKMIQIFCGVKLTDVFYFKIQDVRNVINEINQVLLEEPKFQQRFSFEGVDYGFIPNLDDISFGEYIDLDENMTSWDSMHKAMSVLYRPIEMEKGDRYTIKKYDGIDNEETMKKTPVDIALGASVFFYNLRNELQRAILKYSSNQMEELTSQQREILLQNGVGFNHYILSLREILEDLEISQN
jgi:hypothetical protein|tara:strand:+ start:811 stop:1470 length:660 start_codon:yes stop_codon:yes gene_type:complete